MKESTLTDFFGGETGDEEATDPGGAKGQTDGSAPTDGESATGELEVATEGEAATGESEASTDDASEMGESEASTDDASETDETEAPTDGETIESSPPVSTYTWGVDERCDACGERASRRWRRDGLVCPACVEW